ncbi:tetratricopeptide repeat protein [Mariniblastus sp.]|jgi:tetratricopeptide (TPR) repeat protein|nr:tetratricopeptide repeat protein [Mariniblastus sp.]
MSNKKLSPEIQAILSASDASLHATTISLVKQFLIEQPDSPRAWIDLGRALAHVFRFDEAEQAFGKVIEMSDANSAAAIYGEIGNLYRTQGKFEDAIQWYEKQISADEEDALGYLYLGNLLLRQGNSNAAETVFRKALDCKVACFDEVHYSLGLVYRALENYADAASQFKQAIELNDRHTEAKVALKDVKQLS